ncbi:MAG: ABC transporter permease subunit [Clostridiales bacterium]|nr:ABC transporter permease subunit [Clostridiales bacterium]
MTAIFKKEVKGLLTSMVGFVFMAFLLLVCGIYFTAYNLQAAYPKFAYTLSSVLFVFLIAVPILTMRVLAEEQKQKTDQLLLTAPVTVTEIVMGKFLALVVIFLIPVAVLSVYPLIMAQFGTVYFAETYTAMFGFFLMGCSFLAIGLFISSLTESQVIAAVLTFLVLFVCYVIDGIASFFPETAAGSFYVLLVLVLLAALLIYMMIKNVLISAVCGIAGEAALILVYVTNASAYEGLIQDILDVFDLSGHFSEFYSGIFDVTGLVYYISVIGVFLFLTVETIQKRRWS